ncbi:MAG: PilZ domain-containing protein [Alphaproteobacteria bacterium]
MRVMFESLLSKLKGESGSAQDNAKRRNFERRDADHCVGVIDGKTYPIENWSPGGVLIYGDSRPFGLNDEVSVTLKFRLRNEVIDVPHKAKVVRKSYDKVAFKFSPLTQQIKKSFQTVVDDYLAGEFADSQLA